MFYLISVGDLVGWFVFLGFGRDDGEDRWLVSLCLVFEGLVWRLLVVIGGWRRRFCF